MSKLSTIAFAQVLAAGEADETMLDQYYVEAVRELGHNSEHLTNISLVTGVALQAAYEAPAPAVRILSVFYGQRELYAETFKGLGASAGPFWRGVLGDPLSYTTADTNDLEVRLFPVPVHPGETYIPLTGLFGASYPDYNVFLLHTEERTEVPAYLELYLAMIILSREFARDSPHQDYTFASACAALATLCLSAVQ